MNIYEATKKAVEQGKGIIREKNEKYKDLIIPTNTYACCIGILSDKSSGISRWNPTPEDLTADDWTVSETSDVKE